MEENNTKKIQIFLFHNFKVLSLIHLWCKFQLRSFSSFRDIGV